MKPSLPCNTPGREQRTSERESGEVARPGVEAAAWVAWEGDHEWDANEWKEGNQPDGIVQPHGGMGGPGVKPSRGLSRRVHLKDARRAAVALELDHDIDHLGAERGGQRTALFEDRAQLVRGDLTAVGRMRGRSYVRTGMHLKIACEPRLPHLVHLQLNEAVAEGAREHLAPAVRAWRVLRREEHKVLVRPDDLGGLGDEQLAIVVEQPVERLEHLMKEGRHGRSCVALARVHRRARGGDRINCASSIKGVVWVSELGFLGP